MDYLKLNDVEKKNFLKKFVFKDIVGKKISDIIIPDRHYCSRYVVACAKTIYNWKKEYTEISGNAWNLRYNPNYKVVYSFKGGKKLDLETLRPGMFLLVYNKLSLYNGIKDKENNLIDYTHVILYVGKIDSKLYFMHMYDSYSELIDFEGLFSKTGKYFENEFEIKEVLSYVGE